MNPVRLSVFAVIAATAVVAAAAIYDRGGDDRIAPGVHVAGIDVGGRSVAEARSELRHSAALRRRVITVLAGGRELSLTPGAAHVAVDIEGPLQRALADSRRGWLGVRVAHRLLGRRVDEHLPLPVHVSATALREFTARVAAVADRKPTNATVTPSAAGLKIAEAGPGVAVNQAALRRAIAARFRDPPRPARIVAPTRRVAPHITRRALARRLPSYVVVDRDSYQLRFYSHLRLDHTYPIAVGRAGLETPAGLYDVQWREVNPPWRVPNSPWAGALAGKTIPPGPQDPIKARWLAFNGGAGIHGTDEVASLGHNASHGCIRMRIPDVIELYDHAPVGTPVFIG